MFLIFIFLLFFLFSFIPSTWRKNRDHCSLVFSKNEKNSEFLIFFMAISKCCKNPMFRNYHTFYKVFRKVSLEGFLNRLNAFRLGFIILFRLLESRRELLKSRRTPFDLSTFRPFDLSTFRPLF